MRRRGAVLLAALCLAWLAANASPDDKLYVRGGELGRFDPDASAQANLRELIARLRPSSDAWRKAEFAVVEQTSTFLRFTQVIGGIPVNTRNEVDLGEDGRILEVRLSVVDPSRAPRGEPLTLPRARQIASAAWIAQSGVLSPTFDLVEFPGLRYERTAQEETLRLEYRFAARSPTTSDIVTVDALTGAVRIASALIP